jgi:hypothetical protein
MPLSEEQTVANAVPQGKIIQPLPASGSDSEKTPLPQLRPGLTEPTKSSEPADSENTQPGVNALPFTARDTVRTAETGRPLQPLQPRPTDGPTSQPSTLPAPEDLFSALQDDLALPDFAPSKKARNLTLIGGELPEPHTKPPRHLLLWALVAITLAAVVAAGVWRKTLVALVLPVPRAPAQPISAPPAVEAQAALAAGVQAYTEAKYPAAIAQFDTALRLDPSLAEAHRSLGIVYATQHDEAKAVQHYRLYLQGRPHAADAPAVHKIVHDYELTQHEAAKAAPKSKPPAPAPAKRGPGPAQRSPASAQKGLRPGKKPSGKAPLKKKLPPRHTPQR